MRIYILITLIISFNIIIAEEIHDYTEILVHTFNTGEGNDELGALYGEAAMGTNETDVTAMCFDKDDNLIINDYMNFRTVIYNKDFTLKKIYTSSSYANYLYVSDSLVYGVYESRTHFILNKENSTVVSLAIPAYIANKFTTTTVFTDNVIFSYLKDGSIVSFVLEDLDTLKYSEMLDSKKTRMLFSEKKKYGLDDFHLDSKDRIFYNGKLQNRDHDTMYKYWVSQHKKNNEKEPRKVPKVPKYETLSGISSLFIGEDNDGNYYRSSVKGCIIFDKNGWVLDYFRFDNRSFIPGAINSKGDVFYLARDNKDGKLVINLYKIERQW